MNDKIQISTINLLKRLLDDEHKFLSSFIFENFKIFIKGLNIKNILIVYNAEFEPNIDLIINYCNQNNIETYIAYTDKRSNNGYCRVFGSDFKKELFSYTIQPSEEYHKKNTKIKFDLFLFPVMAFNSETKECIDYDHKINYIRLINMEESTLKCAYAYNIQEYYDLKSAKNKIEVNCIITDLSIVK